MLYSFCLFSSMIKNVIHNFIYNKIDYGKLLYFFFIKLQCSLVKPPPSVQSVVWRYNECGDKLRDSENRKSCDQMKRTFSNCFKSTDIHFALVKRHKYK